MESNGLKLANPWFHTFISPYTTQVTPSTRLFPRPTTVHGCTRPARAVCLTVVAGQSTDDPRRQQTRVHHCGTRPQQFSQDSLAPWFLRACIGPAQSLTDHSTQAIRGGAGQVTLFLSESAQWSVPTLDRTRYVRTLPLCGSYPNSLLYTWSPINVIRFILNERPGW